MISGAAGFGLCAQNSKDIVLSEGNISFFFERLNFESFPRLAPIYGDVAGYRGAEETEMRKPPTSSGYFPPNKETPNVALRDSAAALQ